MKRILLILVAVCMTANLWAQVLPRGFNYQAMVRNESGQLIQNSDVTFRISLLSDSESGNEVITPEELTVTTDANGLATFRVNTTGIVWTDGLYFIKTEVDPEGGANYTLSGVSQLDTRSFYENDPDFNAWDKNTGITISVNQITDLVMFINDDEIDPDFNASAAANITTEKITEWNDDANTQLTPDEVEQINIEKDFMKTSDANESFVKVGEEQDISGLVKTADLETVVPENENDPEFNASAAADITADDIAHLSQLQGQNYGDQFAHIVDGRIILNTHPDDIDNSLASYRRLSEGEVAEMVKQQIKDSILSALSTLTLEDLYKVSRTVDTRFGALRLKRGPGFYPINQVDLEVGDMRILNGNPAEGKLLTSDASGKGYWKEETKIAFYATLSSDLMLMTDSKDIFACNNTSSGAAFEYPTDAYNNDNHAFIAPVDGVYSFSTSISWDNILEHTKCSTFISVNDTDVATVTKRAYVNGDSLLTAVSVTIKLNEGDVVRVEVLNNGLTPTIISHAPGLSFFSGKLDFKL